MAVCALIAVPEESQVGDSGLSFTPVPIDANALKTKRARVEKVSGSEPLRLLLVENEDLCQESKRSSLDVARSAADANVAREIIKYDAVVLDLGVPDGDKLAPLTRRRP
jgi:hypothetical protein